MSPTKRRENMALTRKMLKAMGIEEEKIDQIIEAHAETVDALKTERDTYKVEAEKVPGLQKKADEAAAQNSDSWKLKYDAMKGEFETYKTEQEAKATKASKTEAYKKLLKDAKVSEKRLESVLRVSSDKIEGLEIDEQGQVKDADKITETIKTEWADFITTTETKGAGTSTPPEGSGAGEPNYEGMSMREYAAARSKK